MLWLTIPKICKTALNSLLSMTRSSEIDKRNIYLTLRSPCTSTATLHAIMSPTNALRPNQFRSKKTDKHIFTRNVTVLLVSLLFHVQLNPPWLYIPPLLLALYLHSQNVFIQMKLTFLTLDRYILVIGRLVIYTYLTNERSGSFWLNHVCLFYFRRGYEV